jgi:hypothetical protein
MLEFINKRESKESMELEKLRVFVDLFTAWHGMAYAV